MGVSSPSAYTKFHRKQRENIMAEKKKIKFCDWNSLIRQKKKMTKVMSILFICGCLFCFALAYLDFSQTTEWDRKINTYDHVQGTIIKNQRVTRGSGKSRRTVTEIQYKYTYKDREYTGDKIVYSDKYFPPKKAGAKHEIIVNPENPTESAAMIYRHSAVLKYIITIIFSALGCFCLLAALFKVTKKVSVPQQLIDHEKSFPPEKIEEMCKRELNFIDAPKFEMTGKIKYKYHRQAIITNSIGTTAYIIMFLLVLINLAGVAATISASNLNAGIFMLLIPTAVLVLPALSFRPRRVFFDLVENRFWKSKNFHHAKIIEYYEFSDVDFLCVIPRLGTKGALFFVLYIVNKDNTAIAITQVPVSRLEQLCKTITELLSLFNNVPVIVRED